MRPALLALVRIGWRDIVRNRGRSLLVTALVAVPVAAVTAGLTVFATTDPTPEQRATAEMGRADLLLEPFDDTDGVEAIAAELPSGARVDALVRGGAVMEVPGARVPVGVVGVDLDGLGRGLVDVVEGHAPRAGGQAAISRPLANLLDLEPGDHVRLGDQGLEVVGIHREPEALENRSVVVLPTSAPASLRPTWLAAVEDVDLAALVDELERAGDTSGPTFTHILSRPRAARRGSGESAALLVLGSLALVEAALVASAAFAVSTRRRQRELGLVAAVGGDDRHLRAAVLASGLGLGALGSAVGVVVGLGGAVALLPWLEGWADRTVTGLRVPTGPVLATAIGGTVAAVLAAWAPARSASRLPVLLALSGSRPPTGSSRRGLARGGALVATGLLLVGGAVPVSSRAPQVAAELVPLLIVLGSVLTVLGFGLTSPWVLDQLGRLAPRLPLGPRLAVRDTARFRTRNGPVVTAVLAGLALSVAFAGGLESLHQSEAAAYTPRLRDDQVLVDGVQPGPVADVLAERLDPIARASVPGHLLAGDGVPALQVPPTDDHAVPPEVRSALGGAPLVRALGGDDTAVAALRAGNVVVFGAELAGVPAIRAGGEPVAVHAAGGPTVGTDLLPNAVLSPSTAEGLGLPTSTESSRRELLRLGTKVDEATVATAQEVAATAIDTQVVHETGFTSGVVLLHRVVLVLAVLTGLVVLAVALALSAAETRADQRSLLAVGADPRLRRSLAAGRAAVLAGLGGLLAVPAGLLPAWGLVRSADTMAFAVPWSTILVVALGLPSMAVLGAYVLTRPAPRWTAYRLPTR